MVTAPRYKILFFIVTALLYVSVLLYVALDGYDISSRYIRLMATDTATYLFNSMEYIVPQDYHDRVFSDESSIHKNFDYVSGRLSDFVQNANLLSAMTFVVGSNDRIYVTASDYVKHSQRGYFSELGSEDYFYNEINKLHTDGAGEKETGLLKDENGDIIYIGCRRVLSTSKKEYFACLSMSMTDKYAVFKSAIKNRIFGFALLFFGVIFFMYLVYCGISYREKMLKIEFDSHAKDFSEALSKAKEANQIKSEFIAGMSHSIRTSMNVIAGFSEAIKSELFGPIENAKYREYVDHIHECSAMVLNLLDEILDIAKLEMRRFAVTDEYICIHDVFIIVKRLMRGYKGVGNRKIEIEIPSKEFPDLKIDKKMLLQILFNLLVNGVKYTQNDGKIILKVFINEKNGRMTFSVKDDGCGMSNCDCERLNKVFHQDENQDFMYKLNAENGIGLSLVKNYTKMFGGDVYFISAVNCGSEFIVSFPKERVRVKK